MCLGGHPQKTGCPLEKVFLANNSIALVETFFGRKEDKIIFGKSQKRIKFKISEPETDYKS